MMPSNYLSVSEYAKLYSKDPGNIRRLLASGRIAGHKIGKQWVVSKDTPYPADKRKTSGQYRNWRKRIALNSHKELMMTLSCMIADLRNIYDDLLSEVILYGSYARGTQTGESDVDIALILSGQPDKKMTDAMINCVASHELICDKVLSVIDIHSERFNQWKDTLPFYKNIEKEGIILWKAAA